MNCNIWTIQISCIKLKMVTKFFLYLTVLTSMFYLPFNMIYICFDVSSALKKVLQMFGFFVVAKFKFEQKNC